MLMKKILLEFIMMAVLIILSGIVLANDAFRKSEHDSSAMKEQLRTMDNETISAYRTELQHRIRDRAGINKIYRVRNRNSIVDGNQYFYAGGSVDRYRTIRL